MKLPQDEADLSPRTSADAPISLVRRRQARRLELLAVVLLVVVAGVAHGLNMGNFPYYEDDEGTYVSQAWSVIREGQLAPYYYI